MTITFDPKQYKVTTKSQWDAAAEAWHRWGPVLEAWLGLSRYRALEALEKAAVLPACSILPVDHWR